MPTPLLKEIGSQKVVAVLQEIQRKYERAAGAYDEPPIPLNQVYHDLSILAEAIRLRYLVR